MQRIKIIFVFLGMFSMSPTYALTDAEIEETERAIEQLEKEQAAKAKRKVEVEAKRKAEEQAKRQEEEAAKNSLNKDNEKLSGRWQGTYKYQNQNAVTFTINLMVNNNVVTGNIFELNTFADKSHKNLYSYVEGSIEGSSINFTKTYDGTAGVSHSILYKGKISKNLIRGKWYLKDASGTFEMRKI